MKMGLWCFCWVFEIRFCLLFIGCFFGGFLSGRIFFRYFCWVLRLLLWSFDFSFEVYVVISSYGDEWIENFNYFKVYFFCVGIKKLEFKLVFRNCLSELNCS